MHILFVTPNLPVPTSSARVRPFNLIKQLATRHEVSVISFIQPGEHAKLPMLEPYCKQIELVPLDSFRHLGPWQNRMQGWFHLLLSARPRTLRTFPIERMQQPLRRLALTEEFDVAHFEQLYLVELLPEVGDLPAVLGEQNVEFQVAKNLQQVSSNPVHRVRDGLSWKKMLAFETYWVKRFAVCVAVSEQDAALLRETSGHPEVQVVTNGVDCQSFAPVAGGAKRRTDTVLFFGTLNYGPNRDGIVRFCRNSWPLVRAERPEARLEIVGIDPPPDVRALGELPGVVFTGFVPDIRTKLWTATMSIAPLRWGGGTRLKIVESLAAGCPVVSTSAGVEGLELADGQEIRIADRPEDLAQAILDLMNDPDKRAMLSWEGRRAVAEKYDWKSSARQLELAYERAIRLGRPIRPLHSSSAPAVR